MYKQYIRQAWQLMKQNRFFSTVYIIGTGLAISMVMVIAVVYHIRTANIVPEVHRDRMCYSSRFTYQTKGTQSNFSFCCGPRLAKEVFMELRTPEAVAIITGLMSAFFLGDSYAQIPGGDVSKKVALMGCNDGFWQIYSFPFLAGKPFSKEDFLSGVSYAVIDEELARRLYGHTEVTGQTILLNDVEYTVCGVVPNQTSITSDVYADVWIPYTSMFSLMKNVTVEREGSVGALQINMLLHNASDLTKLRQEINQRMKKYNSTLAEGTVTPDGILSFRDQQLNQLLMMDPETTLVILAVILLLFLLVPALNLSGLNTSHMQDRISELGVRKAFGARRSTLFWQLFTENMLLMLPGGVAGLLFSYVLVYLLRNLLLGSGIIAMMVGATGQITLSVGMLFNPAVFVYTFLICLVLNMLSSLIPAWHAIRVNITEALNS